jgi:ABC-type transport system substrate-binding protein
VSRPRFRLLFRTVGWVAAALLLGVAQPSSAQAPSGEVTVSFHVTLAPSWFDPSTAPPQITPFGVLDAVHDALVRPLPGQKMGPSLAESWTESPDGLAYEFKLRRGLFLTAVGNSGNAASRVEAFIYSKGSYAYGGYPDLDELFLQQTRERDPARREALLHRIQQATVDRVMFAPLMDLRGLHAIGPRLADHTMNVIPMYPFPAYEDIRLKNP